MNWKLSAAMLARCAQIGLLALQATAILCVTVPVTALRHGRREGARRLYVELVHLIERLGPAFVKFGQVLGTRRDVMPRDLCAALATLHDRVPPMSELETRSALERAYAGRKEDRFRYEDLSLLASGSIASVFRAVDPRGREVAVKLRRPGIEKIMAIDLAILERFVRTCERLPQFRGMPLGDLIAYVSAAVLGQLDFERERASLTRIHESLAGFQGVKVPAPIPDWCGKDCLVMEFIPGLRADSLETLAAQQRARIAGTALMAVSHLMFRDGFAHCDLHPGNLYVLPSGELVILDAGYSVQLPENVRQLMGEFFSCMASRRGRRCAEIILESAASIRPGATISDFISSVDALVENRSDDSFLSMNTFGNEMFALQQRFGVHSKSDFAFPLMAIAVLEGTLRGVDPEVDFRQLGQAAAPAPRLALI